MTPAFAIFQHLPPSVLMGCALVLAYLLGAMPFGYWLVKLKTGQDIRQHGSGSTGTTNVKRLAGKNMALTVLALDLLKGVAAVLLAKALLPQAYWLHVGAALMALIGHGRSCFIGFTGGKASATGLGTMLALVPSAGLLLSGVALAIFMVTRVVSVASLITIVVNPILLWLWHQPTAYVLYGVLSAVWISWLHRDNIQRLLSGQEKENKV